MSEPDGARAVAYQVLQRIERDGAYANLALGPALDRSRLPERERRFATDLVYGTTRMRRACDALVDRFVTETPDPATRTLLRLGAYQIALTEVPDHAAVAETVALAPRRTRGFVNAVLRRVAVTPMVWPSQLARLSYPDWIGEVLTDELGEPDALAALERMNRPPPVTMRSDGYVQDESSQWVAAAVEAQPGEVVLDLCAAPGGKATALAATGATVVAADVRPARTRQVVENTARTGVQVAALTADARRPPFPERVADAVLLDAPCSGLGVLRRRADARWRVTPATVGDLAALQAEILTAAAALVRPGGRLIYSVCTLTSAESVDHPVPEGFEPDPMPPSVGTWRPYRHGWRVLPHDADTDGMALIRYRRRR
jgi:16S rRNA (cytosine967-C5)-methyltransferase